MECRRHPGREAAAVCRKLATGYCADAWWDMAIEIGEAQPLRLTLAPLITDQELHEGIAYWEGAVRITGDATGYGYAELTGYSGTMNGRF